MHTLIGTTIGLLISIVIIMAISPFLPKISKITVKPYTYAETERLAK